MPINQLNRLKSALVTSAKEILAEEGNGKMPSDQELAAIADRQLASHMDAFVTRLMEDKARMQHLVEHIVKDAQGKQ